MPQLTCNQCSENKSTTEFKKKSTTPRRCSGICKTCTSTNLIQKCGSLENYERILQERKLKQSQQKAAWKIQNQEYVTAYNKKYDFENKDAISEKRKTKYKAYTPEQVERHKSNGKNFRLKNATSIKTRIKQWQVDNKDRHKAYIKRYIRENKEKVKSWQGHWREKNKSRVQGWVRECYRRRMNDPARKEKSALTRKNYYHNVFKTNPQMKLSLALRTRLRRVLQGRIKSVSAVKDLGCSISELKSYLESKFTLGMTWDNHGLYGWHIDHIRPLASFDLQDLEEIKQAVHYTNLQPLWAEDNLRKHSKWEKTA